jgi:hypothetical protein
MSLKILVSSTSGVFPIADNIPVFIALTCGQSKIKAGKEKRPGTSRFANDEKRFGG